MKTVFLTICLVLFTPVAAFAHGSHGIISGQKAISIANSSLKRLAFKDYGFEVGKLDESWKTVTKDTLNVVDVENEFYIISAKNTVTNKTLYLQVGNNGQVMDVRAENNY